MYDDGHKKPPIHMLKLIHILLKNIDDDDDNDDDLW